VLGLSRDRLVAEEMATVDGLARRPFAAASGEILQGNPSRSFFLPSCTSPNHPNHVKKFPQGGRIYM
jgi:hypothetical protein